ncbi:KfrA N-terminal DNA-binding domain-containing protein [Methylorubrum populi]
MLHRRCTNSTESHRSMSAVPLCKAYARRLVDAEARNTGRPVKDCIRAVARRLREPHGSILALLYRDPKDVRSRLVRALAEEVERTVRGEIASLENELLAVRLGAARRSEDELAEIEADLAGLKARLRPAASREAA